MKKGFWDKFNDLMSSFPDYAEEQFEEATEEHEHKDGLFKRKSVSITTMQNGKTIKVKTVNGKTTVTVNGKEYVEKEKEKK